ncbi:MAG TPA: hypothetical protein DCP92_18955 [Nitrospiraceae bacterium]|jgi:hypothetical protein|nr:hypothetical protein [Nitrospiraceae bacterium]
MLTNRNGQEAILTGVHPKRKRTGVYIIKTHIWYLERLVWIIAAIVLLMSSLLTALHNRNWVVFILAVGMSSVFVSLTGFCVVGNILYRLGVKPILENSLKKGQKSKFYFMQTDRWYLERYIYLIVGINLSWTALFVRFHSLWWLCFPAFVGAATIVFAFTGFCILANLLYRLGAEPRLCINL